MSKKHPTQLLQSEALPPLPGDLLAAQLEIRRLQRQLIEQNKKMATMWEKRELDKRSLLGQLTKLRNALKTIDQGLECAGEDPYMCGEVTARDVIAEVIARDVIAETL